jgi:hypothetical protein
MSMPTHEQVVSPPAMLGRRKSVQPLRHGGPAMAFAVAFVAVLAVALFQGAKPFYYDSLNYWMLGKTFSVHGNFSLLNFSSPLRGYLLYLIDHGLQGIAVAFGWGASTCAKIFNAFVFALIGAVLAPKLAEISWPERHWTMWRRLALVLLLLVFWSGFLNFPLSDFPALMMVLIALVSIACYPKPGWVLLSGIATGAAIDMRPAYVLLAPIVVVLAVWRYVELNKDTSIRRQALCSTLLVVGFLAVSLPQSLSAHRHYHTWSFVPGTAAHLESFQLTEGLGIQRVGGYVGAGHPPLMLYADPAGAALLNEQTGHTITGLGQYLHLVVDHPVTMGGVLGRHLINGLDQRYSTPYVEHLDTGSHRWLRLAGFLLIFLALLRVAWPAARRGLGSTRWRYPVALLLCCITTVPTAMETRFLLPIYLLSYILVLAPGWPNPIGAANMGVRRFLVPTVIISVCLVFMAVVWHVTSGASDHFHFG